LGYMLKGDLLNARKAFYDLLKVGVNDDHTIMSVYWLFIILKRLGYNKEATTLLENIKPDMKCPVSKGYYECIRMFKGEIQPETLLEQEEGQLSIVTSGFGIANQYKIRGDYTKYVEILEKILATNAWSGFGYISAEVDMKRILGI